MALAATELDAERSDLLAVLAQHRQFLRYTTRDLTDDQARARTTVSELTLGGLIKHVSDVERGWARFIVEGPSALGDASAMTEADWAKLRSTSVTCLINPPRVSSLTVVRARACSSVRSLLVYRRNCRCWASIASRSLRSASSSVAARAMGSIPSSGDERFSHHGTSNPGRSTSVITT